MSKEPSYWQAFLTHPYNQFLVLAATAAGVLASFPYGWDALALAMLGLAAVEVVGLAVVPELPPFKTAVDKKAARELREQRRERLLQEVRLHGGSNHLRSYEQMRERVNSLYRTTQDTGTALTEREVEQLDDLTVGYLALCLSDAVLKDAKGADPASTAERTLRALTQRLDQADLSKEEEQQLRRAKMEYEELIARHRRMAVRRSVLEASLAAMPVRMEEVYQMVIAAPSAANLGTLLEESISKLRTVEEVTLDVEQEFGLTPARSTAPATLAKASQQAAGRRAVGERD